MVSETLKIRNSLKRHSKTKNGHFQPNFDEDSLYSPISPDVVDISSDSDDTLTVSPGNIRQLDEKFRINTTGSNLMSAFMGSMLASLYPDANTTMEQSENTGVPEAQLERDLMELLGVSQDNQLNSPNSFIDSEFEEGNLLPWTENGATDVNASNQDRKEDVNSYGRLIARVQPTVRSNSSAEGILPRPIPTFPPNHRPEESSFQHLQFNIPMDQGVQNDIVSQQQQDTQIAAQGFTISPMLYPISSGEKPQSTQLFPMQSITQVGVPFNMTHGSNLLLIPARQRQSIRLLPTVMPNVAGYCDICGKCYDQIALDNTGRISRSYRV